MRKKMDCRKKKQTSRPDSGMTLMWELSHKEYKITMINMLRALMKKKTDKHKITDGYCKQKYRNLNL